MRRTRLTTFFLAVMFIILPIISILMFHHITLSETISNMGSGYFGESYGMISVESTAKAEQIYSVINKQEGRFAVYSDENLDNGITVRAIYFNKRYVNFPLKSGRFFTADDFKTEDFTAVIGKNLEKDTYTEKGKTYITLNGIPFRVIGVIGYEEQTLIDNYIFINGNVKDEVFESDLYTIDILKAEDSFAFISNIVDNLNSKGFEAQLLTGTDSFSENVLPRVLYSRWFIAVFIGDILCLILLSIEWLGSQKKKFCIMRLLGASNIRIFAKIALRYLGIIIASFIVGYIYCKVLYPAYMYNLLMGYSFFLPFAVIFLVVSFVATINEPLEEAIK